MDDNSLAGLRGAGDRDDNSQAGLGGKVGLARLNCRLLKLEASELSQRSRYPYFLKFDVEVVY